MENNTRKGITRKNILEILQVTNSIEACRIAKELSLI